jgi:sugar lactone lactonase YvrE
MPSPTTLPKAPAHYTSHVLLRGVGRPDDLAFDLQGNLLFSDEFNGTVNRLNANGTVTTLLSGLPGPEGIVVLPDGRLIVAEQETNQIVAFAPGSNVAVLLRHLPGMPSGASCKHGVDGIAFDPTTSTLIVPDSPTGDVYRMSLDGKTLVRLASGIVRPVGAGVDSQGNVFIADECGNAVWRITKSGQATRLGGFGMPDDVLPDGYGNLLVIDLAPSIHALLRINLATQKQETLASRGFIEPQGLAMNTRGTIFVADDYADSIVEFVPV